MTGGAVPLSVMPADADTNADTDAGVGAGVAAGADEAVASLEENVAMASWKKPCPITVLYHLVIWTNFSSFDDGSHNFPSAASFKAQTSAISAIVMSFPTM